MTSRHCRLRRSYDVPRELTSGHSHMYCPKSGPRLRRRYGDRGFRRLGLSRRPYRLLCVGAGGTPATTTKL